MSERLTDAAIRNYIALGATAEVCLERTIAEECLARGSEAEGLRAEVERLTQERDEAIAAADATIDVTPGEGLASVVRRVCEESDRTQIELDRATLSASKAHGARKEAEAEVERLRAALDAAKDRAFDHERCAMGPLVGAEGACTPHPTPEAMCCACRLRAAAIPEDAEEIVFKELSIGVFEPQDLEIQEAIHAKRRAKARAVVKALRGQA